MNLIDQWKEQIREARDEGAVQDVVQRYLATIPREEIKHLPPASQAVFATRGDDIEGDAIRLLHDELHLVHGTRGAILLEEMVLMFTSSANRLGQLRRAVS